MNTHPFESRLAFHRHNSPCEKCGRTSRHHIHKAAPTKAFLFHVVDSGDRSVGIQPLYEEVTITFHKDGLAGEQADSFIADMTTQLREMFDIGRNGAVVLHTGKNCPVCNEQD